MAEILVPGDSGAPDGLVDDMDAQIDRLKAAAALGLAGEPKINTTLVETTYGFEEVEVETGLSR